MCSSSYFSVPMHFNPFYIAILHVYTDMTMRKGNLGVHSCAKICVGVTCTDMYM